MYKGMSGFTDNPEILVNNIAQYIDHLWYCIYPKYWDTSAVASVAQLDLHRTCY